MRASKTADGLPQVSLAIGGPGVDGFCKLEEARLVPIQVASRELRPRGCFETVDLIEIAHCDHEHMEYGLNVLASEGDEAAWRLLVVRIEVVASVAKAEEPRARRQHNVFGNS